MRLINLSGGSDQLQYSRRRRWRFWLAEGRTGPTFLVPILREQGARARALLAHRVRQEARLEAGPREAPAVALARARRRVSEEERRAVPRAAVACRVARD